MSAANVKLNAHLQTFHSNSKYTYKNTVIWDVWPNKSGRSLLTFQINVLPPPSGIKYQWTASLARITRQVLYKFKVYKLTDNFFNFWGLFQSSTFFSVPEENYWYAMELGSGRKGKSQRKQWQARKMWIAQLTFWTW